jgi:hypothetical protein
MKQRALIGLALAFSSFFWFGAGTYTLYNALDLKEINARKDDATARQCTEKLNELAKSSFGTLKTTGADTNLTLAKFDDPRGALSTATMAIMMCPNKNLTSFCMGDQCPGSNQQIIMTMTLTERK